jgi:hypothetical protein
MKPREKVMHASNICRYPNAIFSQQQIVTAFGSVSVQCFSEEKPFRTAGTRGVPTMEKAYSNWHGETAPPPSQLRNR